MRNYTCVVEVLKDPPTMIVRFTERFAINELTYQHFLTIAFAHKDFDGAAQRIVGRALGVGAAVLSEYRLSCNIAQYLARTRFHTHLADAIAK